MSAAGLPGVRETFTSGTTMNPSCRELMRLRVPFTGFPPVAAPAPTGVAGFNPLIGYVTSFSGGNASAALAAALPPMPPLGASIGEVSGARRPGSFRPASAASSPAAAPQQRGARPAISTGDRARYSAPAGEGCPVSMRSQLNMQA